MLPLLTTVPFTNWTVSLGDMSEHWMSLKLTMGMPFTIKSPPIAKIAGEEGILLVEKDLLGNDMFS